VLVFTGLTTLAAALCSALLPALLAWRANAADAFRGGVLSAAPRHHRTRSILLAVQATLSLILIAGTALFARSVQAARDADLGYDRERLITTHVWFADRSRRAGIGVLMPSVKQRVERMPGVEGVGLAYGGPMNQWTQVPLYRPSADSAHPIEGGAYFIGVSSEYFALTGTRLVDGRGFFPSDRAGSPPVIVVGASMARQLWPNQRAVGQCLRPVGPSHPCYAVVGVAADVHEFRVAENAGGWQYYYVNEQLPIRASERMLVVRTRERQAEVVAASISQLLRATFPGADAGARTINQSLEAERRPWLLGFTLFGALAGFAIVVAIVGVYGVVSFEVRQRTREIGVRLALGAPGARVVGMLVSQNIRAVGCGVAFGLAATMGAGSYLRSLLYGVTPSDPLALSIAAMLLLIVAGVSAMIPAWRAHRIDPASVLRDE